MNHLLHLIGRKSSLFILSISLIWFNGFSQNQEVSEVIAFISRMAENQGCFLHKKTISHTYLREYQINFEDLNFWNPCKHKLETNNAFLNKEEWETLNSKFYKLKKQRLPNIRPKDLNKTDSTKDETTYITLPILFRDNSYAVYYSEQGYGGQINLLKKEHGQWKEYCAYMVWIE